MSTLKPPEHESLEDVVEHRDGRAENDSQAPPPKPSLAARILPVWASSKLTSWQTWKIVIRSWIAMWAAFILILPSKSLAVLGNAAFFASFCLYMIPPMFPVQLYFFATSTLLLGCLTGWAWGSAAMAAALSVRNMNVTASIYQREESSLAGHSNPDQLFELDLFHGVFLDPAASAVFGVFLATGTFFFGWLRVKAPRLTLFSLVEGLSSLFSSYGVLFPTAQYLILQTFLISAPTGVAIGVVCTILIFPRTLSHEYMETLSKTIADVEHIVAFQKEIVGVDPSESEAAWARVEAEVIGRRRTMLGAVQELEGKGGMLDLEVSRGRYSAEDLKDLILPLKRCGATASALAIYTEIIRNWRHEIRAGQSKAIQETNGEQNDSRSGGPGFDSTFGAAPSGMNAYIVRARELEESQGHQFHRVMPLLRSATLPLLDASSQAFLALIAVLDGQNSTRWHRRPSTITDPLEETLSEKISALKSALDAFRKAGRLEVLGPYASFMDVQATLRSNGGESSIPFSMRPLYYAFTFQSNLIAFAKNEIALLEAAENLSMKRKATRFWAPTGLRKLFHVAFDRSPGDTNILGDPVLDETDSQSTVTPLPNATSTVIVPPREDEKDPSQNGEKTSKAAKSRVPPVSESSTQMKIDPDAGAPTNVIQRFGRVVASFYSWSLSAEGLFAWKYSIISVLLWMPMTFHHSVYFVYTNRGLWGLIMGQTGMAVYVADQIANYTLRLVGTFTGLILGMVLWYIGNGNENGNPYGTAAIVAVAILPLQFARITVPPQLMPLVLLTGITAFLIIGYSWIDMHLATLSNVGKGFDVAWRRWVLVVIGIVASGILMLIPPRSSRSMIRKANAKTLREISAFYSGIVEAWVEAEDVDYRELGADSEGKAKLDRVKARFLKVQSRLALLKQQTTVAKFEINFRGPWAQDEYLALVECQMHMLDALFQLAGVLFTLDPVWRHRLMHRTAFLDPNLVQEINSIFLIMAGSLATSTPIPATIPPSLLDRLFMYHSVNLRDVPHSSTTAPRMTWGELLSNESLATSATARVAVNYFVQQMDRAQAIVRRLCGEVQLQGFSEYREAYERRQRDIEADASKHFEHEDGDIL
ncbi:hypothetical protein DL93DRAFT_2181150 [Clavulina sp. PMI_390]|nr:hypothetical protein DL93DRAFT_2181150 [Clavulina sp. PMI_390]